MDGAGGRRTLGTGKAPQFVSHLSHYQCVDKMNEKKGFKKVQYFFKFELLLLVQQCVTVTTKRGILLSLLIPGVHKVLGTSKVISDLSCKNSPNLDGSGFPSLANVTALSCKSIEFGTHLRGLGGHRSYIAFP